MNGVMILSLSHFINLKKLKKVWKYIWLNIRRKDPVNLYWLWNRSIFSWDGYFLLKKTEVLYFFKGFRILIFIINDHLLNSFDFIKKNFKI